MNPMQIMAMLQNSGNPMMMLTQQCKWGKARMKHS